MIRPPRLVHRILVCALLVACTPSLFARGEDRLGGANIAKLLRRHRAAETAENRRRLLDAIEAVGIEGKRRAVALLTMELQPALQDYSRQFASSAVALSKRAREQLGAAKLSELRRQLVGGDKSLAAKALRELESKLLPARAAVLSNRPALRQQRMELTRRAALWQTVSGKRTSALLNPQESADLIKSLAGTAAARGAIEENERLANSVPDDALVGARQTNRIRLLAGRPPLRLDPRLCAAAADHAQDMVHLKFFAHDSPVEGKRKFTQRARNFKTTAGAENLAAAGDMRTAVRNWFNSPGHKKQLLSQEWRRVGLGGVGEGKDRRWVQLFGR